MSQEYNVYVTRRFERSFRKLNKVVRDVVLRKVEDVRKNPYIGRRMVTRPALYVRVGDYRVFYHLDPKRRVITLVDVRHRRAAYG